MRESPQIALIGTLDTKGVEIDYVADRVRELGGRPIVIDVGILGEPTGRPADIPRDEVARAGGHELEGLRTIGTRGAAVEGMCDGARAVLLALWAEERLDGALCLGGAEGALLGAAGMHAVPVGVPKLIVSPSASGRRAFAPFVGETDTCVMHSVIDILGINPISRAVFDNAAAAVVGMARMAGSAVGGLGASTIGITMLGQTTPGVMRLRDRLSEAGLDSVIFHANGVGGPAMERLLEQGALGGVVDYTLSEIANSVKDGIHAVGPARLTVAGRLGIPQVVVPGCVDFFNQGAPDTLPEEYRRRRTYFHNRVATLVGMSPAEMRETAAIVAARLAEARGHVAVVAPTGGFSLSGVPGEALWDEEANDAFLATLGERLPETLPFELVEADVNATAFADRVAARALELFGSPARTSVETR
ncbi:MAG TPA: Tm-1-like ATP-binding domain-containing protein [Acidimicrobiia bacterium]|nr:Tm-1-like ATP-binding domain-containing protein [Acidimicrobiia bacterium]